MFLELFRKRVEGWAQKTLKNNSKLKVSTKTKFKGSVGIDRNKGLLANVVDYWNKKLF